MKHKQEGWCERRSELRLEETRSATVHSALVRNLRIIRTFKTYFSILFIMPALNFVNLCYMAGNIDSNYDLKMREIHKTLKNGL